VPTTVEEVLERLYRPAVVKSGRAIVPVPRRKGETLIEEVPLELALPDKVICVGESTDTIVSPEANPVPNT
jgi:hypothetical protein